MAGFIRVQKRKGRLYASFVVGKRVNGKKINETTNLGKVIDLERGVFQNRERGKFTFTVQDGFTNLPDIHEQETGIYDFGNAYVLEKVLAQCGFTTILYNVFGGDSDTLCAMLFYRLLQGGANKYAGDWFEGSWAKSLFPKADLRSQRLSDFFGRIGEERLIQRFFGEYLPFAKCSKAVLIDSTGLPNAIDMPITAVSNHCGKISSEVRWILVNDKETHLPIYFRYAAGNIVDVTTLSTTLGELEAYNVAVEYALLDAGYCSEDNVREMYIENINFVTWLGSNRNIYKSLCNEHLATLRNAENIVKYRDRLVYIKRIKTDLYGNVGYAYLALDLDRHNSAFKKYMLTELTAGEKKTVMIFILCFVEFWQCYLH